MRLYIFLEKRCNKILYTKNSTCLVQQFYHVSTRSVSFKRVMSKDQYLNSRNNRVSGVFITFLQCFIIGSTLMKGDLSAMGQRMNPLWLLYQRMYSCGERNQAYLSIQLAQIKMLLLHERHYIKLFVRPHFFL